MPTHRQPYGSWPSPISAAAVAAGALAVEELGLGPAGAWWVEVRGGEGGRGALVHRRWSGETEELSAGLDVRSRVHEYGGGAALVGEGPEGGFALFCHAPDQRLFLRRGGAPPRPLTPPGPWRYADLVHDPRRRRVVCVREEHGGRRPRRALVAVRLDGGGEPAGEVLAAGADFFAAPRLDPRGERLAWLSWSHPEMPWTGTELWLAGVAPDGGLAAPRRIAGGPGESVCQPEWSPEGDLHFVSDRGGWWNLYRLLGTAVRPLLPMAAELARPMTRFGLSSYAFDGGRLVFAPCERATWRLEVLDRETGGVRPLAVPYTDVAFVRAGGGRAVFLGASPLAPPTVVALDLASGTTTALRRTREEPPEESWISVPRALEFPTAGGATAHAHFYPPRHPARRPPPGELPPLLVLAHPGPTRAATTALDPEIQFWTSRGLAVLDVNYGGSSGFGTAYRRRLEGGWGIVDVDDCVNAARFVADRGWADPARAAIAGGSAGGFTALSALAFRDFFRAGASYCGIADLARLRRETHDFEASYLEHLIGSWPRDRHRYRRRSPLAAAHRIHRPLALFYGREDPVTPPNQAELLIAALRARGVPVVAFGAAGEGHGFRRAENLRQKLELELAFFGRHLGFAPAAAAG
jgi:dipeptidyl aminopeptidase/acylaminoacyl peptidase